MKKILILMFACFSLQAQEDFIVIAMGESCGVTAALEVFDLKKASYPFEWCISNFEPLYNSLKNDFHDFTNPVYFTRYIDNRSPVNKYGIVFAHDFPVVENGVNAQGQKISMLDPNWPALLPAVQQKYQRRIDRFHAACTSGKKVYFVRFLGITSEWAERLSKLLSSLYPQLDFTLICVRLKPPYIGTWNINRMKNYYVDTTATGGDASEWRKIFLDLGIIPSSKSWDADRARETYQNSLCKNCSYCQDFFKRS
ncbi:MAG: DUF1796 family putative cysteine peptidase [Candidatus Babeliales bacterium]|nr:DUF1796 family putative cysteine peptidase [Candidatus Babeliales bacterium]